MNHLFYCTTANTKADLSPSMIPSTSHQHSAWRFGARNSLGYLDKCSIKVFFGYYHDFIAFQFLPFFWDCLLHFLRHLFDWMDCESEIIQSQNHEIIKVAKNSKITKSNCQSITTIPTNHVLHCHIYIFLEHLHYCSQF